MAYLSEKLEQLGQAINKWKESLDAEFSELNRDAAIQRFEFTFELFWKTVKIYLKEMEKIECYSPKSCFREARKPFRLEIDEIETCLKMADDRNFSVHTYSEKMANALYRKLKKYWKITNKIYRKMSR
ncbi:nucleotidyltransferase substrate binding protein [Candidatus Falkowbacteria bacterium]|nr:nucleotidyltransferase substrate binding protein [Candidatus Falkowbacteria bacterium]